MRFGIKCMSGGVRATVAGCVMGVIAGCASPGPPRAPSLNLPDVVTDLQAIRIGDGVELSWTTPQRTTDGLAPGAGWVAVVCREEGIAKGRKEPGCGEVLRVGVVPGASHAVDGLPVGLKAGADGVLGYRVEVQNAKGRSAGWSGVVYAGAGKAPGAVDGLRVKGVPEGVEVSWGRGTTGVEISRTMVRSAAGGVPTAKEAEAGRAHLAGTTDDGAGDTGGVIDVYTKALATYRYTAWRVRHVDGPDGGTVDLRGVESAAVEYTVRDTFPPAVPEGLVYGGMRVSHHATALAWEPVGDADLAGYMVYRRAGEGGGWVRVTAQPVVGTAYDDASGVGQFFYRVTAVDRSGNESGPSNVVEVTVRSYR